MGKAKEPDYQQLAAQQGEANQDVVRDQTYANRPTQYTPWGATSWTNQSVKDPSTGKNVTQWSQTESLTPELQGILNKQVGIQDARSDLAGGLMNRAKNEFGTPMSWEGLPDAGVNPMQQFTMAENDIGDPNAYRQHAEDAVYQQASSRLDPQFANKRKELETQLRNQGLSPQDAAWKSQFEGLGNQENDARNQALWSASGAGRDESNAMFTQMMNRNQNTFGQNLQANQQNYGQMMQGSQYANALRQQALTEQMQKRGFSLNEINALLSGQQVSSPQMPSFTGASQAAPAPIYQAGVDQGNFDQAAQQQMTDAITGAGKAAMMSDRRLKRNIRRVGTVNGYPWYTFEYIWGVPGQGVMADEVPAEFTIDIAGYKAVDYNRVLGV